MNSRLQASIRSSKMVVRLYILTSLDLNESWTATSIKCTVFPLDFAKIAWKLDFHRWSSKKHLAEQKINKEDKFSYSPGSHILHLPFWSVLDCNGLAGIPGFKNRILRTILIQSRSFPLPSRQNPVFLYSSNYKFSLFLTPDAPLSRNVPRFATSQRSFAKHW